MPSIGSTTQLMPEVPVSAEPSSPTKPSSGRAAMMRERISSSLARSASVTTSTALDLVAATVTPARPALGDQLGGGAGGVEGEVEQLLRPVAAAIRSPPRPARASRPGGSGSSRPGRRPRGRQAALGGRAHLLAALHRGPLEEQVADRGHEPRVDAGGGGPDERAPELLGGRRGLGVEVVDDLHVVGDETDRHHHDGRAALAGQVSRWSLTSGSSHGDVRRAGPRAEHQVARVAVAGLEADPLHDLVGDAAVLRDVRLAVRAR